ncbi:ferredoxin [Pseudonocardia nigra]|uniref:ferredoxin n=1 Tax=Pseudonocardia nigra TaxID=1921578 RepID=UPI001C5F46E1|nr:ferredoxin [Pseudonocardia nigra]
MALSAHVDSGRCQGHARCVDICPSVFDFDDEGFAYVTVDRVDDDDAAAVERAIAACPEQAISATPLA